MIEKKEKPSKDDVIKLIIDKNYSFVSSRVLSRDYSPKKVGRTIKNDRGLTHYIGSILAELKNDGVLSLVNASAPSMKYGVKRDKLIEAYKSILQSSPQPSS